MTNDLLYKQDLEAMECSNPGCTNVHPVFISAQCHIGEGVQACYDKEDGCMKFYCLQCNVFVCSIMVAEGTVN
jgi:hypothetical protein